MQYNTFEPWVEQFVQSISYCISSVRTCAILKPPHILIKSFVKYVVLKCYYHLRYSFIIDYRQIVLSVSVDIVKRVPRIVPSIQRAAHTSTFCLEEGTLYVKSGGWFIGAYYWRFWEFTLPFIHNKKLPHHHLIYSFQEYTSLETYL